jgi:hypothetical protein
MLKDKTNVTSIYGLNDVRKQVITAPLPKFDFEKCSEEPVSIFKRA